MVARQASSHSMKSIAGALFLALGFVFLFANLEGIASCINNFAGMPAHEAPGIVPVLGLAGMHAVHVYAFEHEAFLSGLRQNLLSFWPMLLVAIGTMLLRTTFVGGLAKPQAGEGVSAARGR